MKQLNYSCEVDTINLEALDLIEIFGNDIPNQQQINLAEILIKLVHVKGLKIKEIQHKKLCRK